MPRPRRYQTEEEQRQANVAKQARFRARSAVVERASLEALRGRLDRLQAAIEQAAAAGDPLAKECRAASTDTLLDKLAEAFEQRKAARGGQEMLAEQLPRSRVSGPEKSR